MVSIIIPTRDRLDLLEACLDSVLVQTSADWECIVVDDHSTDGTIERLDNLARADSRLHCLALPAETTGANAARNLGLQQARGEFLLFLDSDDALAPFCLEQRLREMESHSTFDFGVFPTLLFANKPGDRDLLWNIATAEPDLERFLSLDIPWQTTGVFWRRKALLALGPWREELPCWQDWEFHLRALRRGLRYGRLGERPDSYWRLPRPDSLWNRSQDAFHTKARVDLLREVVLGMKQDGTWSARRRNICAGLWFWHARHYYGNLRQRGRALDVWTQAWRLNVVSTVRYLEGVRWFSRFLRGPHDSLELVFPRWPLEYRTGNSPTFHKMSHSPLPLR